MKRKVSITLIALLGLIATSYVACAEIFPSGTWRYKITVNVDTPEGMKSGAAVREVDFKKRESSTPETVPDITLKGEAVVVDLGKRGVLFALMKGGQRGQSYGDSIVFDAFPLPKEQQGNLIAYYTHLDAPKKVLSSTDYPMFITFQNLQDASSVQEVNAQSFDNSFGDSVRLKSVEIVMTKDPITWGIEKWLPWLSDLETRKARLNGNSSPAVLTNDLSDNLGAGAFRVGK